MMNQYEACTLHLEALHHNAAPCPASGTGAQGPHKHEARPIEFVTNLNYQQ
jgi:hypothetical protein